MNSGYALVNFGGLELTSESKVTKAGINAALVAALATGKAIVAGGLLVSTKAAAPVAVLAVPDSTTATTINVSFSKYVIAVDAADGCTITDITASAGTKTTSKKS